MSQSRPGRFGVSRVTQSAGGGVNDASAFPQIFNGAIFIDVNVPASVTAGGTIHINGTVGFDCPQCVVDREIRVVAQATHLADDYIDDVGKLNGRGQTAPFDIQMPAPSNPGDTTTVRLLAERKPPIGSWETDNTAGPFSINVFTPGQQLQTSALAYAPFAIGGGAVGAGVSNVLHRSLPGGALVGAGVGVGAKWTLDNVNLGVPSFPTVPVLALAALLGAGGFLIMQGRAAIPNL